MSPTNDPSFLEVLPSQIANLRQESNLEVIEPWFRRSVNVLGDVCEFGCYRGYLSIKMAFYLKAVAPKMHKSVYAFDTFRGFLEGDPDGGFPKVGDYGWEPTSYDDLYRWTSVLPLFVAKGDVMESWMIIPVADPLSFVWFDLDLGHIMEVVRLKIWRLLSPETVIGVDDYGRPECPTVKPWADRVAADGLWRKLHEDDKAFIAFFEKIP